MSDMRGTTLVRRVDGGEWEDALHNDFIVRYGRPMYEAVRDDDLVVTINRHGRVYEYRRRDHVDD